MANDFDFTAVSANLVGAYSDAITTLQLLDTAPAQTLASNASWADTTTPCVCADDDEFASLITAAQISYQIAYGNVSAPLFASAEKVTRQLDALAFWEKQQFITGIGAHNGTTDSWTLVNDAEFIALAQAYRPEWAAIVYNGDNDTDGKNFIDKLDTEHFGSMFAGEAGIADNTGPVRTSASAAEDTALEEAVLNIIKKKIK